jgi:hypothetical protein
VTAGVLSVGGAYAIQYGACQVFGNGWDACSFGGGGPEIYVIAAFLLAIFALPRRG